MVDLCSFFESPAICGVHWEVAVWPRQSPVHGDKEWVVSYYGVRYFECILLYISKCSGRFIYACWTRSWDSDFYLGLLLLLLHIFFLSSEWNDRNLILIALHIHVQVYYLIFCNVDFCLRTTFNAYCTCDSWWGF